MKHGLPWLTLVLLPHLSFAALYDADQINALFDRETSGIRAYQSADYKTAFGILSDTATKGLKESQYLVALMFMKGEGVKQSMLIGLGWLGVAKESGNEEWISSFDTLYGALSEKQRAMVDEQVRRYTEKFGGRTQGVTCSRRTSVGSRQVRLLCNKVAGSYPDYEIELVP
jgi:TPR repeat protein